jgi:hypothetical protein
MLVGDYVLLTFCNLISRPKQLVGQSCSMYSAFTGHYRNSGDLLDLLLEGSAKLKRLFLNAGMPTNLKLHPNIKIV